MNLIGWLAIAAALLPVLYIWCKPLGVCAILLAFVVPGCIYVWAGLEIVTYLWSWALPLAAGLIVLLPVYRWVYIHVSRWTNGWSKLTMEVEDSRGHVHYVKRIDDQTYINGGSGSGKTESCNMAFVRHAVRFRMSMLLHDLKKYELTQAVYPLFAEAGIPYHVFALFDYERCVRINPIDPMYIEDEQSLKSRIDSFLIAAQGGEAKDATSTGGFFKNTAASLLESITWYLKLYKPECCHLPFLMSIINDPDNLHLQNGKKVIPFGRLKKMLSRDPQVFSMASVFFQGADNPETTSNILQTVILALNTINTDAGFFLLSGNDINLRINRPGNCEALALVNEPKNSSSNAPILAMIADAGLLMMGDQENDYAVALRADREILRGADAPDRENREILLFVLERNDGYEPRRQAAPLYSQRFLPLEKRGVRVLLRGCQTLSLQTHHSEKRTAAENPQYGSCGAARNCRQNTP